MPWRPVAAASFRGIRLSGSNWDRVQTVLDGRKAKRHRRAKHDFAVSGLIEYGHCGSGNPLTCLQLQPLKPRRSSTQDTLI